MKIKPHRGRPVNAKGRSDSLLEPEEISQEYKIGIQLLAEQDGRGDRFLVELALIGWRKATLHLF